MKKVKSNILSFIKKKNPDIICFQEYYYDASNDFVRELIVEELGYKYYMKVSQVKVKMLNLDWLLLVNFPLLIRKN